MPKKLRYHRQWSNHYLSIADPSMPLKEWKRFIEELIKYHGEEAILTTDAGHNNVELLIRKLR